MTSTIAANLSNNFRCDMSFKDKATQKEFN